MSELPVFVKWLEAVSKLSEIVQKFPKQTKDGLGDRILNLSLDIAEDLIESNFSKNKTHLKRAKLNLEKIEIHFKSAQEQKVISVQSYRRALAMMNGVKKMMEKMCGKI